MRYIIGWVIKSRANIDGLDSPTGSTILLLFMVLDQMTLFHHPGDDVMAFNAPWDNVNEVNLHNSLLEVFNINNEN